MFSFGKRSVIAAFALFLIIGVVGWAWRSHNSIPYVTSPLQTVVTPLEEGVSWIADRISSISRIIDISMKNRIEWEQLEKENAGLREKTVDYDEITAENTRLRKLLGFREAHKNLQLVAGPVISRDYGTWTNTMIIGVGENEGIKENMAVITPDGVVGFISDVFPSSARVQLLTDPRTSIGAIVQRAESRVASVVRGNGNMPTEPQFVNIAKDADILEGDNLVTSGFGTIYPKGLYVGKIVSVHSDDSDFVKYAVIQPGVDFSKLEEVFVITALVVFILQSVVLPRVFNGIVQPNLILLFVIIVSLRFGQRKGTGVALLGGFLQDVVIGNFFGIHILPYLLVAALSSYLGRSLEKDQYILLVLLVLVITEAYLVFTYLVLSLSGQFVSFIPYLAQYSVPLLVSHGILARFADRIVRKMYREDAFFGFMSFNR